MGKKTARKTASTGKRKTKTKAQAARGKAIAQADHWFSLYIRARDGRSVTSNASQRLTCSHLFSRRFYATRWDEMNAYCQTAGENLYHNRDPGPLTMHFLNLHGDEEYQILYKRARSGAKFTTEDIERIAAYWKMRYEQLKETTDYFNVI